MWNLAAHSSNNKIKILVFMRRVHFTSLRTGDMMFGSTTTVQNENQLPEEE